MARGRELETEAFIVGKFHLTQVWMSDNLIKKLNMSQCYESLRIK